MKPTLTCHAIRAALRVACSPLRIDHQGLLEVEPPAPSVHLSSVAFRHEWFVYNLARKREVDRPETTIAAKASFDASEARCAAIEKDGILTGLDWLSRNALLGARKLAFDLLGCNVPTDWLQECTFTGGASTSRSRSSSHPALKWWACPSLDVTPLALTHLQTLFKQTEALQAAWGDPGILSATTYQHDRSYFRVVPGSHLQFVEKNYKTKRAILIEPDGNMLLQKAVGNIIRKKLRRVGINLNSQELNQRLAFAGSVSGSLGTIDLSAASDSVTLALLRLLLPESWYELIYELRSPCYNDGTEWKTMRKVSSMGNGFTFELESLVFYCLSKAVVDLLKPTDTRIAIFGDDIIVASSVCGALESVLNRCGFSLNVEKSYWHGPFRESCGKHYHSGVDVTPVYLKADLDCLSERYRAYNQVRAWVDSCDSFIRVGYKGLLSVFLDIIPLKDRIQVPVEYSPNEGLYYPDVVEKPITFYTSKDGWEMATFRVFRARRIDLTRLLEAEVGWLYRHMEQWQPSCKFGFSEYTPLSLVREGKLEFETVDVAISNVARLTP